MNKVRKLEYLVADAMAQGCDTLVSIGGIRGWPADCIRAKGALPIGCRLEADRLTIRQWAPK